MAAAGAGPASPSLQLVGYSFIPSFMQRLTDPAPVPPRCFLYSSLSVFSCYECVAQQECVNYMCGNYNAAVTTIYV